MEKLPKLPRMAAVHDLSGMGKCSLTVALPIVSATGVECCCIPTAKTRRTRHDRGDSRR